MGDLRDDRAAPPNVSFREHMLGSIPLVISLVIFAMFLPAVIVRYAFSDDYPVLYIAEGLGTSPWFGSSVVDTVSASGRPLAGLLDELFFSAAGTIDNLRFVRLVGVIGIVALALLLHWALVRSGIESTYAALIAVLICSQPAFQVYGSWAVMFNVPYAAILGGAASLMLGWAVAGSRKVAVSRVVGATALLLSALFVYQSAAMFFWVFLAIALIGSRHDSVETWRLARIHFLVAAFALAVAFLTTKLVVQVLDSAAPNVARNTLAHDVIGKGRWFLRDPLYQSLNLFDLTPSPFFAVVVVAVTVGGILLLLDREGIRSPLILGIGLLLIPLSFLPSLVVAENSPTYRVQVALTSMVVLYASLGALGVWLAIRDVLGLHVTGRALVMANRLVLALAFVFVGTSVFVGARNVMTLMVEPQSTELRILRRQVAALPAGAPRVAFVQISWYQGLTARYYSDELGLSSSARPWTPEPAINLILREQGRLAPKGKRPVVDILPWDTTVFPDEPLINLGELEQLR